LKRGVAGGDVTSSKRKWRLPLALVRMDGYDKIWRLLTIAGS
jgi:hypothetical protein